jgi:2-hydroxy-6-oxonona-2,4-dienedioate hydrolase
MSGAIIQYPLSAGALVTRVLEGGQGGEHVVFVHGLGARADRWSLTLPGFAAAGYHGYAFDLPGHGFATKGKDLPLTVPAFAGVLTALLDTLGIDRAFLVGTSLGGHVAASFACSFPRRVRGLILVGAVGLVPITPEQGNAIRTNIRQTSREAIARKMAFVFADPGKASPSMIEEEWRINNSPGAAGSFEMLGDYIADKVNDDGIGPRLAALMDEVPTVLVWGREDKAVPLDIGERAQALLGGAELIVIDDAGHAPYFEQPAEFDNAVLARIARWRASGR